jgi:hypothetical protein
MAAVKDRRLRQLHAYWAGLCDGRRMPSREDVDPLEVPALLPFIFLIDVLDDPQDFRFRLAGTHFREFAGEEVTGKRIGEIFPPEFCAEVRMQWAGVVAEKAPKSGSGQLWVPGREYVSWEGVILPLSPDGDRVTMFLGGGIFASESDAHKYRAR